MRFDFEMGIAVGEALQRLRAVDRRVSTVEGRVDRLELVMRGVLLVLLAAAAVLTNVMPQAIADLIIGVARKYLGL